MKVLPISYSNYHAPAFESRKKENNNYHQRYISNTIKTIPLAALLAMSPLNNAEAQNVLKSSEYKNKIVEKVFSDGEKHMTYTDDYFSQDAIPDEAKVTFISSDGDDIPESVRITYEKNISSGDKEINGVKTPVVYKRRTTIYPTALKIVNVTQQHSNGTTSKHKEYYIVGEAVNVGKHVSRIDDTSLDKMQVHKEPNAEVQIYKEFYDKLADTMNRKLEYLTEDKTVEDKGIEPFLDFILHQ